MSTIITRTGHGSYISHHKTSHQWRHIALRNYRDLRKAGTPEYLARSVVVDILIAAACIERVLEDWADDVFAGP